MIRPFACGISLILGSMLLLSSCASSRKVAPAKTVSGITRYSKPTEKELRKKYAQLLQVSEKEINNLALYYFIDEWMGVPYKYGGNTQAGVDCSGFTCQVYQHIYQQKIVRTSGQQYHAAKRTKKTKKLNEGDLVFFDDKKGRISHVGIYLHNGFFVHSSTQRGVIISHLEESYWQQHFAGGGKI